MSNQNSHSARKETLTQFYNDILSKHLLFVPRQNDIAYHYTTLSGLKGIIESGNIWASDIRFLNDSKEIDYTFELAEKVLNEQKDRKKTAKNGVIDDIINNKDALKSEHIFVTSFSLEKNLLSQWRAYGSGQGGFSIGISLNEFLNNTKSILSESESKSKLVSLYKCVYDEKEQKDIIRSIFQYCWNNLSKEGYSRENLLDIAITTTVHLSIVAPGIKHPAFSEEKECRLVCRSNEEFPVTKYFRQGELFLIPYLKLPISDENGKNLTREVVIGPNPDTNHTQRSIKEFLAHKAPNVEVEVSDVPFRRC